MSASSQQSVSKPARSYGWQPGQSGNPGGRAKKLVDIGELAKQHGPECVAKCVSLMRHSTDERVQMAAAKELLDRGFGKPAQSVSVDGVDGNSVTLMHLLAAKAIARLEEGPTLEARVVADDTKAQPTNGTAPKPNIFEPARE